MRRPALHGACQDRHRGMGAAETSQGADQGAAVHALRHARQQLADLRPRNAGCQGAVRSAEVAGSAGFRIESFHLTGAAFQKDEDARWFRAVFGGPALGAAFSARKASVKVRPSTPTPPTWSNSRLLRPWQFLEVTWPMFSMEHDTFLRGQLSGHSMHPTRSGHQLPAKSGLRRGPENTGNAVGPFLRP